MAWVHAPAEATGYFEGLLPEGEVRQRVCRETGVANNDPFGLLLAIGGDCAGALSIVPPGAEAGDRDDEAPDTLDDRQILELARSGGRNMPAPGRRQRFSLAGAQEKLPVIFEDDRYALPDRMHPSSHILKFETVPRVCLAEYLANRLARATSLPVADTTFVSLNGRVPMLRITRFDRILGAGGVLERVHQEDLLQALGLPSMLKYQREGGPTLAQVAAIVREHTRRPAVAIAYLRDWQMFNCLTGNWDGHAKNLALLYPPDSTVPELAPFYDLVAIEFLNRLRPGSWSRDMAFAVGTQVLPERITRGEWERFADDLGIPRKPTLERLEEMALALPEAAVSVARHFAGNYFKDNTLDRFVESIRRRCGWVVRSVFGKPNDER